MENKASKGEKTLLWSFLLSAPGPLATGYAVMTSRSATQLADFLRRTTELVAIFVSWRVYRTLRHKDADFGCKQRLQRTANLCVGGAMIVSGAIMLLVACFGFSSGADKGNVTVGLTIAILGLVTNSWFWWRYHAMSLDRKEPIMEAQRNLYQAKSLVDLCVVTALGAVAIAPMSTVTSYIDVIGSAIVALFLLWNGTSVVRKTPGKVLEPE